jgi:hypothetical protein
VTQDPMHGIDIHSIGDGAATVMAHDTDGDGKPDRFLVDVDGDGEIDMALYDDDGDGKIDRVVRSSEWQDPAAA